MEPKVAGQVFANSDGIRGYFSTVSDWWEWRTLLRIGTALRPFVLSLALRTDIRR